MAGFLIDLCGLDANALSLEMRHMAPAELGEPRHNSMKIPATNRSKLQPSLQIPVDTYDRAPRLAWFSA